MKSDPAFLKYPNSDTCINRQFSNEPFTVAYLVAWSLRENEAGGDLVLIETSLLFLCKLILISMRTALTYEKQGGVYQNKVTSSLTFIQKPGTTQGTIKWSIETHFIPNKLMSVK